VNRADAEKAHVVIAAEPWQQRVDRYMSVSACSLARLPPGQLRGKLGTRPAEEAWNRRKRS
jgi:hypothetical protein